MPKDSTVYPLLNIYNTILVNLDTGKDVRSVFCDISKAFDRIWHKGILFKLQKNGVCDDLIWEISMQGPSRFCITSFSVSYLYQ